TITYLGAQRSAGLPYDRALSTTLQLLIQQVRSIEGQVVVRVPPSTEAILRGDETDSAFYLVHDGRNTLLAGDRDLPLPPNMDRPLPGVIQYRDAAVRGFPVRVA